MLLGHVALLSRRPAIEQGHDALEGLRIGHLLQQRSQMCDPWVIALPSQMCDPRVIALPSQMCDPRVVALPSLIAMMR